MPLDRRTLLAKALACGAVSCVAGLAPSALAELWQQTEAPRHPTPTAELGPFYKRLAPDAKMLRAEGDAGLPLDVAGQVFSARGDALPGASIEIWQTDHRGIYDLDHYRYRATLTSDSAGKYDFSSVIPGHYPARLCQHVHYLVHAPGCKPLVTQLYFATDPAFEGDPDKNYTRDPVITSRELVRPVSLIADADRLRAAVHFELVLENL